MLEFLKTQFLVLLFFRYIFNDLPGDFICNIAMVMILLSTLIVVKHLICYSLPNYDQASDFWKQLALASEPWSDLRNIADWCKKWLVDFNLTGLITLDATDMKMDGSLYEEKSFSKMLRLTLHSKLDWSYYPNSISKTTSKCSNTVNPPYGFARNTVVMPGLVLLAAN